MLVDAPVHVSRARDMDSRNDAHDLDARNNQGSSTSTRINVENEVAAVGRAEHRHVDPPAGARVDQEDDLLLEVEWLASDHKKPAAALEFDKGIRKQHAGYPADVSAGNIEQQPLLAVVFHGKQSQWQNPRLFRSIVSVGSI